MGHFCGYMENVLPLSSFTCPSPLTDNVLVSQPVLGKVYLRMYFPNCQVLRSLFFWLALQ